MWLGLFEAIRKSRMGYEPVNCPRQTPCYHTKCNRLQRIPLSKSQAYGRRKGRTFPQLRRLSVGLAGNAFMYAGDSYIPDFALVILPATYLQLICTAIKQLWQP